MNYPQDYVERHPFLRRPQWTWTKEEHEMAQRMYHTSEQLKRAREDARDDHMPLRPGGTGYGGSAEWPFDTARAIASPGYCKGIVNAIQNAAYHPVWRHQAKRQIDIVVRPRVAKRIELLVEAWEAIQAEEQLHEAEVKFLKGTKPEEWE